MKNDREIMQQVRSAIDDCTRSIHKAPSLRYQILKQAKGEPPVKKKISAALALAMVLTLLVSGALAATLLHSDVLDWLFRTDESQPPQEIVDLLNQPQHSQETDFISLTLNETLFDGRKLSLGFNLENPGNELLVYTIGNAELNGQPLHAESTLLPYGNSYGQALGGKVNSQAKVIATFVGVSAPAQANAAPATPAPLQAADEAQLAITVNVYRPHVQLVYLAEDEYLGESTFLAPGVLAMERETNLLQLKELLAAPDPHVLELVDSHEFTFPIKMNRTAITTVSAAPGMYENRLFSLTVEEFTLSASSGLLEGHIAVPSLATVKDALPEDLSFFYAFPEEVFELARETNDFTLALNNITQSGTGSIDPETHQPACYEVKASFGATAGTLPHGVYLVWMTGNLGSLDWDTAMYIPMQ